MADGGSAWDSTSIVGGRDRDQVVWGRIGKTGKLAISNAKGDICFVFFPFFFLLSCIIILLYINCHSLGSRRHTGSHCFDLHAASQPADTRKDPARVSSRNLQTISVWLNRVVRGPATGIGKRQPILIPADAIGADGGSCCNFQVTAPVPVAPQSPTAAPGQDQFLLTLKSLGASSITR